MSASSGNARPDVKVVPALGAHPSALTKRTARMPSHLISNAQFRPRLGQVTGHCQHRLDRMSAADRYAWTGRDGGSSSCGLSFGTVRSCPRPLSREYEFHLRVGPLLHLVVACCPKWSCGRLRTRPGGCPPRRRRTRGGGPRCARQGGSRRGIRGGPWVWPTRRARHHARVEDPSAGCAHGALGSRTSGVLPEAGDVDPWVRACSGRSAWPGTCRAFWRSLPDASPRPSVSSTTPYPPAGQSAPEGQESDVGWGGCRCRKPAANAGDQALDPEIKEDSRSANQVAADGAGAPRYRSMRASRLNRPDPNTATTSARTPSAMFNW